MKKLMTILILIVILLLTGSAGVIGQTPYDSFAPEAWRPMLGDDATLTIDVRNESETDSVVEFVVVDIASRQVLLVNSSNQVLAVMQVEEDDIFLDEVMRQSPDILTYMKNACENGIFDFKNVGKENLQEEELHLYNYRGSVSADGKIASARDWGNMAAGWVAGKLGLSWPIARFGFDGYQTIQTSQDQGWLHTIWQREGAPTRHAEWEGYKQGVQQWLLLMIYGK